MKKLGIAATAVAALLLAGCSKVTMDNYSKLERGMEAAEVEAIIGAPSECSETLGVRNCLWGDENSNISVTYAGSKVINMSATGLK